MARRSVPLQFLDHLLETLHFVADDSKTIRDMKCNRSKGTYLLTECLSTYAHQRLLEGIRTANGISILCDKANDITMKKTFCVNVRYVDSECATTKTKLYRLLSVDGNGGTDSLFSILEDALMEDGIEWGKVVGGYTSDGENLMQGANNSYLTRMKAKVQGLYILKCYCHSFHLVASHA